MIHGVSDLLSHVVNTLMCGKIPEEHDLESQIRKEREWRFLRNARVRKQAQKIIQKGECPSSHAAGSSPGLPAPHWAVIPINSTCAEPQRQRSLLSGRVAGAQAAVGCSAACHCPASPQNLAQHPPGQGPSVGAVPPRMGTEVHGAGETDVLSARLGAGGTACCSASLSGGLLGSTGRSMS